jgi:alginate O-acetyltransferase complex protein AlgI
MLFCSQQFLIFFLVVFAAYWALPRQHWRVYLLCGASFYFYASWNKWLAVIIFLSTFMDYCVALAMDQTESVFRRRVLLGVSLVANLSLLVYFKYMNFFLGSVGDALNAVGASAHMPLLEVILPIGISFYTFEAINYTVDVYRRKVPAERNLFHFLLFITFFPHLIAGPIVRARDFLPQIRRPKHWDWLRMQLGMQLFLIGLVKKIVIADRMAIFADPIFADPHKYSTFATWIGVLAYAIQIYCDFSGYTDMALGTAHMLGYKLARNFNMPYIAVNVSDFWRRWHISLSTWLRDYLFIPLGGSRGTTWIVCRNLMITMALGGLWHGAAWTFVIWGVLHGFFLIVHRGFQAFCEKRPRLDWLLQTVPGTALRIGFTFLCVCVGWVFFRATSFASAVVILKHMAIFQRDNRIGVPMPCDSLLVLAGVIVLGHVVVQTGVWKRFGFRVPAPVWGIAYGCLVTLAMVLAPETGAVFIYFQF